jgi:pimeloyl-ACP methyl ester carboxylesterase
METRQRGGIGFIAGSWPLDAAQSTIVFIHASGGSAQFWQAQVQGVAAKTNTLALDLPGHGGSESGGKDTVEAYATAIVEFLDHLDVPGPIPCGLSLGGAVAQQLLLDYPDRFSAGILIGTGAKLKVLPAIFETIENDYAGFVEMIGKFSSSPKTDPKIIQLFRDELNRCNPDVTFGDFQACNRFNVMARLGEIDVPVLIVSAEDDRLTPSKYADFLESAISKTARLHIADAGHIVPLEKPQAVNQAIIDFLRHHKL